MQIAKGEREKLGQLVRAVWVQYCQETGNTKSSNLVSWEELDEWAKEADRRIGEAVTSRTIDIIIGSVMDRLTAYFAPDEQSI